MKKILITGIGGFTGSYIKKVFEDAGYGVIGLIRAEGERVTKDDIVCDITDKESIVRAIGKEQFSGVIHLAALSFVAHDNPLDFYEVNTIGTQNLLEALYQTQKSLRKIILASTSNAYGNIDSENAISENTIIKPISHYAISKVAMEYVASIYFDKLPIIITRPFNYTGVGQNERFLIPKIVAHYRENKPTIELGNIDIARDFSDVRDVADAYFGLYESPIKSEVVNICSGIAYKLSDIINFMNNIAGHDINIVVNRDFVRENEIKILKGDRGKFEKATSMQSIIPIEETLKAMYYKNDLKI